MYLGSIPLREASLLEIDRPDKTDIAMRNPYHLILITPRFKSSDPGDFI